MLDKFADELREIREEREITLQQISQKTRIDLKYIQAIDKGDFSFLPELYVKAFIRQYAKMIGMDEEVAIKKYEAAKSGKSPDDIDETKTKNSEEVKEEKKEQKEKQAEGKNKKEEKKSPQPIKSFQETVNTDAGNEPVAFSEKIKKDKTLLWGIIGGIVVVLLVIVYFFFIKSGSDIIVAEKPYDEVRKENQQRYIEEKKNSEPQMNPAVTPGDSLLLTIQATDSCWIKVSLDHNKTEEFKLLPNTDKSIKAAYNFSMIVGNAGSTKLLLNDKELNLSGSKNQVRYVSVSRKGLSYLDSPPNFN